MKYTEKEIQTLEKFGFTKNNEIYTNISSDGTKKNHFFKSEDSKYTLETYELVFDGEENYYEDVTKEESKESEFLSTFLFRLGFSSDLLPKKLITSKICKKLPEYEYKEIENKEELNTLYLKKIYEELLEIKNSNFSDITEYGDIINVVISLARQNGFTDEDVFYSYLLRLDKKGKFTNKALINMNENNESNKIYFDDNFPNELTN